ncbi:MAG: hypothetical protein ACI9YE_003805 [Psychroserpens sp.]|jgi:hypothetical protein
MEVFLENLKQINSDEDLQDFARKEILHGTPFVFSDREAEFYEFRKRIAAHFEIGFHEIFITGSGKLGFSPHKGTEFSYDSDIDVAIVSSALFYHMMEKIRCYQMQLRESRITVSKRELKKYHSFLEYIAIGWFRPDLLPNSFDIGDIRESWFDFFTSISDGRSEVGNYKVNAGVFRSYRHLEEYTFSGLESVKKSLEVEE